MHPGSTPRTRRLDLTACYAWLVPPATVDHGKLVEFVLNIKSTQRGRALSLWCPGKVVAIHKRQFGTAVLKPGLGLMGKTCDLIAGAYRFTPGWGTTE